MFDSNTKGAINVTSIGKTSDWAWSQNVECHLQFDMEITYQSSYSHTPNMNSQKINTNIIFVPSLYYGIETRLLPYQAKPTLIFIQEWHE